MSKKERFKSFKRRGCPKKDQRAACELSPENLSTINPLLSPHLEEKSTLSKSTDESKTKSKTLKVKKEPNVDCFKTKEIDSMEVENQEYESDASTIPEAVLVKDEIEDNLSDTSTIPEAMDTEEGFCISPQNEVSIKDVLRIKIKTEPSQNNSGTSSCFSRLVKEERAKSPSLELSFKNSGKQAYECDSDSDDSVIIIPKVKTPPKLVDLLEEDTENTNDQFPITTELVDKEEFINNWHLENISNFELTNNKKVDMIENETIKTKDLLITLENENSQISSNQEKKIDAMRILTTEVKSESQLSYSSVTIKQEPTHNYEHVYCKELGGNISTGNSFLTITVPSNTSDEESDTETVPELLLKSEYQVDDYEQNKEQVNPEKTNNSIKQESMDLCEVIDDILIKQEPMDVRNVINNRENDSNVSDATITDNNIPAVPELLLKSECKSDSATISSDNKTKRDEHSKLIEEKLKILRARIKKEPAAHLSDVRAAKPETVNETCGELPFSNQSLENANKELEKRSQASNDKNKSTENFEVEKDSNISSNETQKYEIAKDSQVHENKFSTDILKYFHLNTVMKKGDLEMCLIYLSKCESKRDRNTMCRLFFGGPHNNENTQNSHPSLSGESLNIVRPDTLVFDSQPDNSVSQRIKELEIDQCKTFNKKLQNAAQEPPVTISLNREKPICIPQPSEKIIPQILTKDSPHAEQNIKIKIEKNQGEITNEMPHNARPQIRGENQPENRVYENEQPVTKTMSRILFKGNSSPAQKRNIKLEKDQGKTSNENLQIAAKETLVTKSLHKEKQGSILQLPEQTIPQILTNENSHSAKKVKIKLEKDRGEISNKVPQNLRLSKSADQYKQICSPPSENLVNEKCDLIPDSMPMILSKENLHHAQKVKIKLEKDHCEISNKKLQCTIQEPSETISLRKEKPACVPQLNNLIPEKTVPKIPNKKNSHSSQRNQSRLLKDQVETSKKIPQNIRPRISTDQHQEPVVAFQSKSASGEKLYSSTEPSLMSKEKLDFRPQKSVSELQSQKTLHNVPKVTATELLPTNKLHHILEGNVPQPTCKEKSQNTDQEEFSAIPSKKKLQDILQATARLNSPSPPITDVLTNFESSVVGPISRSKLSVDTNEGKFKPFSSSSTVNTSLNMNPKSLKIVPKVSPDLTSSSADFPKKRAFPDERNDTVKKQKVDSHLQIALIHNSAPHSSQSSQRKTSIEDSYNRESKINKIDHSLPPLTSYPNSGVSTSSNFGLASMKEQPQIHQYDSPHLNPCLVVCGNMPTLIPQDPRQQTPHFSSPSDQAFFPDRNIVSNYPVSLCVPTNVNMLTASLNVNRDPRRQNAEASKYCVFQSRIGTETSLTQFRFQNIGKVSVTREFPFFILQWHPGWLQTQKQTQRCPPICEAYPFVQNDYKNELHYYNTYLPLHMLSVWLRIFDTWLHKPSILHVKCDVVESKIEYTNIICSITRKAGDVWPKREDIVLCKSFCSDGYISEFFGRIVAVSMRDFNDSFKLKLEIHCLAPAREFEFIDFQIIFNVRISLLQSDALENLNSNFRKLVLNPSACKRRISKISCEANANVKSLRDKIINAIMSPENQVLLVDTSNVVNILSLIANTTYKLKEDFVVFLCIKNEQTFRDVSHRLKPYNPIIAVRTKEITLSVDLMELTLEKLKGESRTTADVFKSCRIILTVFSAFVPKECNLVTVFTKRNVVCIVDDADLCIEAETALPLKFKFNKLVLLGKPSRALYLPSLLQKYGYDVSLFKRFSRVT